MLRLPISPRLGYWVTTGTLKCLLILCLFLPWGSDRIPDFVVRGVFISRDKLPEVRISLPFAPPPSFSVSPYSSARASHISVCFFLAPLFPRRPMNAVEVFFLKFLDQFSSSVCLGLGSFLFDGRPNPGSEFLLFYLPS